MNDSIPCLHFGTIYNNSVTLYETVYFIQPKLRVWLCIFFWNIRINDELKYPQAKKESINFGRFERIFFKKTKLEADYLILFNWCCNATGNFSLISYYCNQISTFVLMMGSIERNVPKTLGNYDVIYMCVVGN